MKKGLITARSNLSRLVKMLTTKITNALSDWIREWRKCRKENPSLDDCIKFTEWKIENYELTAVSYTHLTLPTICSV